MPAIGRLVLGVLVVGGGERHAGLVGSLLAWSRRPSPGCGVAAPSSWSAAPSWPPTGGGSKPPGSREPRRRHQRSKTAS